jgi:hypothetical protein
LNIIFNRKVLTIKKCISPSGIKSSKWILFLAIIIVLDSCKKNNRNVENRNDLLVKTCKNYLGTPYKFGGVSKDGMDCSGLIYKSFIDLGSSFPRVSYKQADHFEEINKSDLRVGDLVYFKVNSNRINHTGIISKIITREQVYFIHASTSKGVIEDHLFSKFWQSKFVKVTRPQL